MHPLMNAIRASFVELYSRPVPMRRVRPLTLDAA